MDTTTLIGHLRGRQNVVELVSELAAAGHRLGVCPVNIAELYAGITADERARADQLTNNLEYFQVTGDTAKEAGRYRQDSARRGTLLSTTDALLAATAAAEDAILVTANAKDFPMEGVRVLEHG